MTLFAPSHIHIGANFCYLTIPSIAVDCLVSDICMRHKIHNVIMKNNNLKIMNRNKKLNLLKQNLCVWEYSLLHVFIVVTKQRQIVAN